MGGEFILETTEAGGGLKGEDDDDEAVEEVDDWWRWRLPSLSVSGVVMPPTRLVLGLSRAYWTAASSGAWNKRLDLPSCSRCSFFRASSSSPSSEIWSCGSEAFDSDREALGTRSVRPPPLKEAGDIDADEPAYGLGISDRKS